MSLDDSVGRPHVWLASYPKSGNTWVRAILTALLEGDHLFAVNSLHFGHQPHHVAGAQSVWGIDPRWFDRDEMEILRAALLDETGRTDPTQPGFRKTHDRYRDRPLSWPHGTSPSTARSPVPEPFPADSTRGAILVVRDPRDVACSYAAFFDKDLDTAIDELGRDQRDPAYPARALAEQSWGSWSSHAESWLDPGVPFPVHLVRYEGLHDDAVGILHPILQSLGMSVTTDRLSAAVDRARFDRLQREESTAGFREVHPRGDAFFRAGRAGRWRNELSMEQVQAIEDAHHATMTRLGYELATTPTSGSPWWPLPAHLGITVEQGRTPDLVDAHHPHPSIALTATEALMDFPMRARLYVSGGDHIVVDPGDGLDHGSEAAWLVQGWGVTLAMLQRGLLTMHAAAVRLDGRTVCIAGGSGAGKSTTAVALANRGHDLLVDDVSVVSFAGSDDQPAAFVHPFARNVHLLPDAAAALGIDFDGLPMLSGGRSKAGYRPAPPPEGPQRIERVIVLESTSAVESPTTRRVGGAEAMMLVRRFTHRMGATPAILGQDEYFARLARLANACPVVMIRRPSGRATLDEVADLIEADLDERVDEHAGE